MPHGITNFTPLLLEMLFPPALAGMTCSHADVAMASCSRVRQQEGILKSTLPPVKRCRLLSASTICLEIRAIVGVASKQCEQTGCGCVCGVSVGLNALEM